MSEKIVAGLGDVQKTLFLPLWGRAMESQRESPLLIDPAALAVIERVDFDFSSITNNISELTTIGWIMRSIRVDEAIRELLAHDPCATIVNIGCGLDTTFDRVDNGRLNWVDLDLPDVIALRRKFFEEDERRKMVAASFLEEQWMDELRAAGRILFIAAGVFYYFEEDIIKGFFQRLADRFPGGEILFDASSPLGVKIANRMVIKNAGLDERSFLVWGLDHAEDISDWDSRFKICRTISFFNDPRVVLKVRLMGLLSDALRIQTMIHVRFDG